MGATVLRQTKLGLPGIEPGPLGVKTQHANHYTIDPGVMRVAGIEPTSNGF
jgi:hypothetical protein